MAQKAHILCHYSQVQRKRRIGRIGGTVAEVFVISRGTYLFAFFCLLALMALSMTGCGGSVGIHSGGNGGAVNCGGCGSSGGGATGGIGTATTAPVTLTLIDPPTCASPRNTATHFYLTVAGVQLNPDANATAASTGWVDVGTTLAATPKQMDLFNPSPTIGNLLNSTTQIGSYGALRLLLAPTSQTVTANQCNSLSPHCLVSGTTIEPIAVTAEADSGIVLNATAITGAPIDVTSAGQNVNILFDSCASLIQTAGGFKMLPKAVAWGGGVQKFSVTLSDAVTQTQIGASNAIIALEKSDSSGTDRIVSQATPDPGGVTTLYGPPGVFDLVAVATGVSGGTSTMYSPLALTGVGNASGGPNTVSMALTPEGIAEPGTVRTSVLSNGDIDFRLSVVQDGTLAGSTTSQAFTIPILGLRSGVYANTTLIATCTTFSCDTSAVEVPSQPLFVQPSGGTATMVSSSVNYTMYFEPFRINSAGLTNCGGPLSTQFDIAGHLLSPLPGQTATSNGFNVVGTCQ
jgi:hypothetical protein